MLETAAERQKAEREMQDARMAFVVLAMHRVMGVTREDKREWRLSDFMPDHSGKAVEEEEPEERGMTGEEMWYSVQAYNARVSGGNA